MRKLIILRGAMGCGKSTFIKTHNLERFTLCSDEIRLMFNSPEMNTNYSEEIPQYNNKKVWELLFSLLEERMKKGEFTIIDAVHAYVDESFPIYKKLAEKYRYRLYILDFTDIPIEEVYRRNRLREAYRIVPESSIDRVYKAFAKEKIPSSFKVVKPECFDEIITTKPRDFNEYDRIHIIGDIHGCYTALKKYFEDNPVNRNAAYIFLGDYFDRGIENYETFRFLYTLMDNENMIFLLGNHEDKLYKYACDDEFKMDYGIENTIKEFQNNNLKKSEIRGFIKRLSQISYFTFAEKTYLATHGGIPYIPNISLDFYSTNSYVYGIEKYDIDIDELYNNYMEKQDNKIYQIHGHRNFSRIEYDKYQYSLNLEGDIEHGGYLRVLTLEKDGELNYYEVKNEVYNPTLTEQTNIYNLIENLRKSKYVFEKELGCGISSFNFSKEAFYNRIWDNMTVQARGLFIDTINYKILARSYNKFFKIDERKETSLSELEDKLSFPVNFYLKYNGFLGILSIKDDELYFASKSTNTGSYVEYFKNVFYNTFTEKQIEALKEKIIAQNVSIIFEIIDPVNDPHIIEYKDAKVVLLDMIYNRPKYEKIPYQELKAFADSHGIFVKELIYTASDFNSFQSIYESITDPNYKLNDEYIEGFVIEDAKNFMAKTKSHYYDEWKYLRSKMEYAIKNNNYKSKKPSALEEAFLKYLECKYKDKDIDIDKINIIEERNSFYNSNND